MRPPRTIALAALLAAALCNFWVLEFLLADHRDTAATWISDLASRTQPRGWAFQLLEIAAGLAVAGFALLVRAHASRPTGPDRGALWVEATRFAPRSAAEGILRAGLASLALAGLLTAIGGAAPLGCAEALEPGCSLSYDALDLLHSAANLLEVAALLVAFALVGVGLLRGGERTVAIVLLLLAADWLLLSALSGLAYLVDDLDSLKGLFQRGAQLLLAIWVLVLGFTRRAQRSSSSTRRTASSSSQSISSSGRSGAS